MEDYVHSQTSIAEADDSAEKTSYSENGTPCGDCIRGVEL
jgi:hypothetical protein